MRRLLKLLLFPITVFGRLITVTGALFGQYVLKRESRDAVLYAMVAMAGYEVVYWSAEPHENVEGRKVRVTEIILRD